MIRFWFREVAGWLLVLLGLAVLYLTVVLLLNRQILESGPMALVGIMIFRGGIHLLKVAVAAQVCLEARPRPENHAPARIRPARDGRPGASARFGASRPGIPNPPAARLPGAPG